MSEQFDKAFEATAALLKLEAPAAAREAVSLAALLRKQLGKLNIAVAQHGNLTERTCAFVDAAPLVFFDLGKKLAAEFDVEPETLAVPPPLAHNTAASLMRALRVLRVAVEDEVVAKAVVAGTAAADAIIALSIALTKDGPVDVEFKGDLSTSSLTSGGLLRPAQGGARPRRGRGRGGRPSSFEMKQGQRPGHPEGQRISDPQPGTGIGTDDPGDREGGIIGNPLNPQPEVRMVGEQFCVVTGDEVGPCFPSRAEAETEAGAMRMAKGLPTGTAEAGIHVHALERENGLTKLDGAHQHAFAVEMGGEMVLLITEEDGTHQHEFEPDSDEIEFGGEHTHKVQLPDGTVVETGAAISGHEHQLTTEHTAFDGIHIHTLELPDAGAAEGEDPGQVTSLLGSDLWALMDNPPQAGGTAAPSAGELARLAPGVAMKALSTTALALDVGTTEALMERSDIKMLASPRRWDIGGGEVLLVCEGVALGVAKIGKTVEMDAAEFTKREPEHRITAERRADLAKADPLWDDTPLFGFPIEHIALFDDPCGTSVAADASGVVKGVRLEGLEAPPVILWRATEPPADGDLPVLKVDDPGDVICDATAYGTALFISKRAMQLEAHALVGQHERMHGIVVPRNVCKVEHDDDAPFYTAELELRVVFDPPLMLKRDEKPGPFAGRVDFAKEIAHPAAVDIHAFIKDPGAIALAEVADVDVRVLDRQLHVMFEEGPEAMAAGNLTPEMIIAAHKLVLSELVARGVGTTETDALSDATMVGKQAPRDGMSQDELRAARDARSAEFGIEVLETNSNLTFPSGFPDSLDEYGDPVNLKYPLDTIERARNARVRFKQNADEYSEDRSKRVLHTRIIEAELDFGVVPSFDPDDPLDAMLPSGLKTRLKGVQKRDVRLLKQDGTEPEERYVFGIVLVPNEPDAQGDIYDAEAVRAAAHSFMEFFGGRMKLMHKGQAIEGVKVIETYLTKTAETHGGETLPTGTWLMAVRVVDDAIWDAVKGGEFTGFSIGGTAIREALAA